MLFFLPYKRTMTQPMNNKEILNDLLRINYRSTKRHLLASKCRQKWKTLEMLYLLQISQIVKKFNSKERIWQYKSENPRRKWHQSTSILNREQLEQDLKVFRIIVVIKLKIVVMWKVVMHILLKIMKTILKMLFILSNVNSLRIIHIVMTNIFHTHYKTHNWII